MDRVRAAFGDVAAPSMPVMAYAEGGLQLAAPTTDRFAVWGQGFGAWGHNNGDGNAARLNHSTGGFLMGADAPVFDSWRLGLLAGYSRTNFDARDRNSSGSSDNYHLGLYDGTQWGALGFRSGLAYSWQDISTSRTVAFSGFGDSLKSKYNAGTFQAFGEFGYRIDTAMAAFEPFANLAYVNLDTGSFSEQGGAAALHAAGQSTDTTFTTLGLRASTRFMLGGVNATARGTLGWQHAFGDIVPLSAQAFATGDAFTIAGVPIARDAALIETGLDLNLTPSATLGLSYQGQIASSAQQHGFKVNLGVTF
jgi:fibronectin-binding autotransporter adhesin